MIDSTDDSLHDENLATTQNSVANDEQETTYQNQIIKITIPEYEKVPEGHVVYKVLTKTNMPQFSQKEMIVQRRFSDFLGLYDKIVERNAHLGIIIPIHPGKNLINSTFLKFSNENNSINGLSNESEFLEHRRIELERFVERLGRHSVIRNDPSFREFLEHQGNLPKATNTQIFSSTSALKMVKKVSDSLKNMAVTMEEADDYFLEKSQELVEWEKQLSKLSLVTSTLCDSQNSLANEIARMYKTLNNLGEAEDNEELTRLLKQLGQLYEQIAEFAHVQGQAETIYIQDGFKDFLKMIYASKKAMDQRTKAYQNWKEYESTLYLKRAERAKSDQMNNSMEEISQYENFTDEAKEKFDKVSTILKKEFLNFDHQNFVELRNSFSSYLKIMIRVQEDCQRLWSSYLAQAKA